MYLYICMYMQTHNNGNSNQLIIFPYKQIQHDIHSIEIYRVALK